MKNPLPPNVDQALRLIPGPAAIPVESDGETAIIVKTRAADIRGFRGRHVTIAYRFEAGLYPEGAAVRIAFDIHDRPGAPYRGEAFFNPASEFDATLLAHLARQTSLTFHFYDISLRYHFSKLINHRNMVRREVEQLAQMAADHNAAIPADRRNFPQVTYRFQQDNPL